MEGDDTPKPPPTGQEQRSSVGEDTDDAGIDRLQGEGGDSLLEDRASVSDLSEEETKGKTEENPNEGESKPGSRELPGLTFEGNKEGSATSSAAVIGAGSKNASFDIRNELPGAGLVHTVSRRGVFILNVHHKPNFILFFLFWLHVSCMISNGRTLSLLIKAGIFLLLTLPRSQLRGALNPLSQSTLAQKSDGKLIKLSI